MRTIDTHAHLDHLENLSVALEEAVAAGVGGIIAVSMDLASIKKNLDIKKTYSSPDIYPGLGIHPGNVKMEDGEETLDFIRAHIKEAHVIGEIGLDFWYKWVRKDDEKKARQREVFRRQLEIAREFDLPVVVHSRGTWRECLETVKGFGITGAVFHWYSGPIDVLDDILSSGYFVSASPALASSPQSRAAMAHAPIEQTLIETDCPVFYHDRDHEGEGFTSAPKDVFRTLRAYAELKKVEPDSALGTLNDNAKEFLRI